MAKKTKIPKTFAGVKLPKALRRDLRDLAATRTGRATLLDALTGSAAHAAPKAPGAKTPGAKAAGAKAPGAKARKLAATVAAPQAAAPAFIDAPRREDVTEAPPTTTPPSASTH